MNKKQLIVGWAVLFIFFFHPYGLFAQAYSKQDIKDLVNHFRKYDKKLKDHFVMHKDRLNELTDEIYKDSQTYNTKESLKKYIESLFDRYIKIGNDLNDCLKDFKSKNGYYKPSQVSPECHKLNLDATYLELRMRLLGYIYQDIYKEPYLNE